MEDRIAIFQESEVLKEFLNSQCFPDTTGQISIGNYSKCDRKLQDQHKLKPHKSSMKGKVGSRHENLSVAAELLALDSYWER